VDRDRAVDESGNQIAVFGRVGARPLNKAEMTKMHRRPDGNLYQVSDDPFDRRSYQFPESLKKLLEGRDNKVHAAEKNLPPIVRR